MTGQTVGNYRITGRLGEGGMGAVFMAEHQLIGRKAAIKVLHPEMSAQPAIVQRFFNEARATTLIRHPGIVDVFDFGHLPDGRAFIAMEYLEGESLAARLKARGRLPLDEIAAIGRQAAAALGAAHDKGIVHRDLKPDNIFLCPEEDAPGGVRVKILDFGIAKLAPDAAGAAGLKTRTGAMMGTPVYMSPEQCRSAGEVDFRSDIYSLGCVLYEMACGQPPFVRDGMGEVLAAHIYETPPPPRSLDTSMAPAFEALLLHALAKRPDARTPTMAQLRWELESAAGLRPSGPPADSPFGLEHSSSDERTVVRPVHVAQTTTLGSGAAQATVRPTRSRATTIGLAALIGAVGLGVFGWIVVRPSAQPHSPESKHTTVSTGSANAAVQPPAVINPPAAPATVHLRIESDPAGADVLDSSDGRALGQTPLVQTVPRAEGDVSYTLRLAGYEDAHLTLDARSDGAGRTALHSTTSDPPKPSRHTASHGAAQAKPDRPAARTAPKKKKADVGLFDD